MLLIAAPTYRKGSYVMEEYLKRAGNMGFPVCLATCEEDFAPELEDMMYRNRVKGTVLRYTVSKPNFAHDQCWNSTAGRNAIRNYVFAHKEISHVLFLDTDMILLDYLLNVPIDRLLFKMFGYSGVVSRYPGRLYGDLSGFCGCCLLSRWVLEALPFRCIEWPNGHVLDEGDMLELDMLRNGFRINRGYFVGLRHYSDADTYREVLPHAMPLHKRLLNCDMVRRAVLELSLDFKCNLPAYLQRVFQ